MERLLVLEDGSTYRGRSFGGENFRIGELVFNTSMTGYQEILTDNAYCGQIVMMTYPLIGNYGINRDDYESIDPATFGLVVKDYCEKPSNWRSQESLDHFLKRANIPGIYGVDTRAISRKLRDKGNMKATLCNTDADIEKVVEELKNTELLKDQVSSVSTKKVYPMPNRGKKVVVVDFGVTMSTLRDLSKCGLDLIVVEHDASVETIMSFYPDGVCLSSGPGNPCDLTSQIEVVKELMKQTVATNKVKITHQNHGYAVDVDSLEAASLEMTYQALNDKSCEGIEHKEYPAFGIQFYPQTGDALYGKFVEMIEKGDHNNA